jgi:hypothetical protein
MVDRLLRELGHLRDEARAIDPRVTRAAVIVEIDHALSRAADAIDATMDSPEENHLFVAAVNAVASVRTRLRGMATTGALIAEGTRLRATVAGLAQGTGEGQPRSCA